MKHLFIYKKRTYRLIEQSFYKRDTLEVARALLGAYIIRRLNKNIMVAMIVETEAYPSNDPASHAFGGCTKRNRSLFGPVGHSYVYFLHNHYCLNVVAHDETVPAGGVLIRAVEPILGIDYMKKKRHVLKDTHLTNGPGKLTQAMAIGLASDGIDVTQENKLMIAYGIDIPKNDIQATRRIGISKWRSRLRRFIIKENRWVSR